jgi:glycosyltransferase involved in cell wall biosynthesis
MLDDTYVGALPPALRRAYSLLPTVASRVLEGYRVRRRYDAVVSWADRIGLPFAALLKVTGTRIPYVAILLWISKPKKARLLRQVHSHIDRLFIPSPRQRQIAIERLGVPASKVVAIPWSVDSQFWRPLGMPADLVCAVGSEMRDYPTLIEAMRGLPMRCHLAAGTTREVTSPWVGAIGAAGGLPPNVTVGKLPFSELRMLYARSRLVTVPLLPTDNDNGVTTILEAMAMGKAVVCSRTEGQVGVVVDGETGLYVPPGDPRALREAIRYLWDHPDVADRMGRAGRARVLAHYRFDDFVSRVKAVVEEVVAAAARRRTDEPATSSWSVTRPGP